MEGGPRRLLSEATSYKPGKHVPVERGVLAPQPAPTATVFSVLSAAAISRLPAEEAWGDAGVVLVRRR